MSGGYERVGAASGHFAALEAPGPLIQDIRAFFASISF
jgi:hypothetical protein